MGVIEFMSFDRFYNWIGAVVGAFVGSIIGVIGGWNCAYTVLILLMVVDYITGIACAIVNKELSSSIGFMGIFKKLMMCTLVLLSVILDSAIGDGHVLRDATVMFYTVNEAISIIENAATLGVPFPDFILAMLKEIKENENKGVDNDSQK